MEFYEKSLEEAQRKEKEVSLDLKNQKREHFTSTKEVQMKFEQQIKEINAKLEQESEAAFEWESKFQELEQRYEQEVQRLEDTDSSLKKDLQKARDAQAELTRQNDILKKKYVEEVEGLKQSSEDEKNQRSEIIYDLEQRSKQAEE